MGILSYFQNKKPEAIHQEMFHPIKKADSILTALNIQIDYSNPIEFMNKTNRGYLDGINGLYPQELNRLVAASPLHTGILEYKKLATVGNGYTLTEAKLDGMAKIALYQLTNQIDNIIDDVAMDYFIHSKVCIKVTWNSDSTKILKLERISPEKVHIDDVNKEMQPLTFLYNWDWTASQKYETIKYPIFNPLNKKDKVQIYFYQLASSGMKLYTRPTYQSGLNWIVLDSEMSQYHKANILNSLNPSMLIQYLEVPDTDEKKSKVLYDLTNSFGGARKTGRAMVTFSEGKDLAPLVTQFDANKLDKTFLSLGDKIQEQICYSHSIDPDIIGFASKAGLGNSNEFLYATNLFISKVVDPAQKKLEAIFNKFLDVNGYGVELKLNKPKSIEEAEPAKGSTSSPSVASVSASPAINDIEAQAKASLKGSVGGVQGILEIQKSVSDGVTDYSAALAILDLIYGINESDAKKILGTPKIITQPKAA